MKRWLLAAFLLFAWVGDAVAQSYSELAPQGYIPWKRTRVTGVFEGCQKNQSIAFDGETVFICRENNHHMAYQPPVIILKDGVEHTTYAVLIDGRAYKGEIQQLEGVKLARPLVADDVQGGPTKPILGADAIPLPGVPKFANTPDEVKPLTLIPTFPFAPGAQSVPVDPLRKANQNFPTP
jgi:hypothetical protein